MSAGMNRCAVPASIHCDHLIQASEGAESDLQVLLFWFYGKRITKCRGTAFYRDE